jgi:hypothetical protein
MVERDYADTWDRGGGGDFGIGVPMELALGEGAIRGDMGAVTSIDERASSVNAWSDPGYASVTVNVDRGANGTGFTTLDLSGIGLRDERFASGDVVVFDVSEQTWDNNVYVSMIGCSDTSTNHWDATAERLEVRTDPETPEEAKRVDFRATFPGSEPGFGQPATTEQTVSGSAVIDLTAQNTY